MCSRRAAADSPPSSTIATNICKARNSTPTSLHASPPGAPLRGRGRGCWGRAGLCAALPDRRPVTAWLAPPFHGSGGAGGGVGCAGRRWAGQGGDPHDWGVSGVLVGCDEGEFVVGVGDDVEVVGEDVQGEVADDFGDFGVGDAGGPDSPGLRLRALTDVFAYAQAEGVELRLDATETRSRAPYWPAPSCSRFGPQPAPERAPPRGHRH